MSFKAVYSEKMDESRKYKEQAETWRNRAAMAHRQGNKELTVSALDKMWQYLTNEADLEGRPRPNPPDPETYFDGEKNLNDSLPHKPMPR